MERVGFTLDIRPESLKEYAAKHAEVWPDMQEALRDAGWHNYTLFLRADGLAVGYLESDDFQESLRQMDALDVNERWQASMRPLVASGPNSRVDQALQRLQPIFHLA